MIRLVTRFATADDGRMADEDHKIDQVELISTNQSSVRSTISPTAATPVELVSLAAEDPSVDAAPGISDMEEATELVLAEPLIAALRGIAATEAEGLLSS